ncbi:MAG TPA: lysophospholipid acyltransferase family protein [Polyangiaceae bacterium]|nr:lysophospholipid acyltransferase family protein [Polyangiaceae bacterium]
MFAPVNTAFSLSFTLAMSHAAVVSSLLDPSGETTRTLARFWGSHLCRGCGLSISVAGGESVAWREPLIVMANHQSYLDVPVLYAALPDAFGMLAKQELFRLPIFAGAMRALRCIPIDRQSRRQSFVSLREAAERVRRGNSIVVFPEGTRSSDERIQELKKGPFYLAEMAGVPIVPVGIRGTGHALAKNGVLVRSSEISVRIGTPLTQDTKGGGQSGRERLRGAVFSALVELAG